MVNITAFQCPICRMRISNWLRKYKHNWDAMVNEKLWEAIQLQYSVEIQKRLNDEDDGIEERNYPIVTLIHNIKNKHFIFYFFLKKFFLGASIILNTLQK